DRVREIDRGRPARKSLYQALWGEGVDLLRVQFDLQTLNELLRIADFLLVFEELAHPLEIALVALIADPALFVFPVRGDPFLRHLMHRHRPDLDFEGHAVLADDRRMQ